MLDRANRIAFASSDITHWSGHDYESMAGLHITFLLPELLARVDDKKNSTKTRMRKLQQLGRFKTYACHADGSKVPTVVSLQSGVSDSTLSLLLSIPDH